jgi:hypothetical protein
VSRVKAGGAEVVCCEGMVVCASLNCDAIGMAHSGRCTDQFTRAEGCSRGAEKVTRWEGEEEPEVVISVLCAQYSVRVHGAVSDRNGAFGKMYRSICGG